MNEDRRWGVGPDDDEDTGELPNEMIRSVLAQIRREESVRRRAIRLQQARRHDPFELDASLDGPPPLASRRSRRTLWSPVTHFLGLTVLAATCLAIIGWMLA